MEHFFCVFFAVLFGNLCFHIGYQFGLPLDEVEEETDDPSVRNVDEIIRKTV